MIHRLKIAMAALCLALSSQTVLALGLGEVTLLSKLNQPLNAEIELLQLRDLNEDEILIALASREDFARIGIDRPYFLTDLTFKTDLSNPNKPKVIVKSKKIVQEPFLNFLVQAQWPSGRILREYTLLLDLPVFSQRQAPSISAPSRAPSASTPTQSRPVQSRPVQSRPVQQTSSNVSGNTITVAPNETLWEIARQVRPNKGYSIQQTMLALQRLNPDAFINNNINLLKKGQVLRIPDADDINNIDQKIAISSVAEQNAQWSGNNSSDDDLGAQLSAVKQPASQQTTSASNEGRLKLVSPEATVDNTAGKLSGAGDSQAQALKSELAVTLEELEKTNRDNTDLRTQVQSLEDQIKTLESLIDVTNEDMRALELAANKREQELLEKQENLSAEKEAQLAALKDAAEQAQAEALAQAEAAQELALEAARQEQDQAIASQDDVQSQDDAAIETIEALDSDSIASEESVDDLYSQTQDTSEPAIDDVQAQTPAVEEQQVEQQQVEQQAPEPVVAPVRKAPKASLVDRLIDNILYIGIAFILLIGGVLFWIQARAKGDEEDEFDNDFDESAFMADIPDSGQNDDGAILGNTDTVVNEDFSENEFAPSDIDADLNADDHQIEAQTTNAATESEIYISLGQFDEAENLLLDALSEDTGNVPIKLKLLEVYAAQNASVKFNEFYSDVMTSGQQSDIDRANDLRATVDGIDDITVIDEHDVDEDKTQLQFHTKPDASAEAVTTDFDLDLSEGSDDLDRLERGDTLGSDEIMNLDDSLEQISETLDENDLTELDLNLDDVSGAEDELTLDDMSHQEHTEVLNETVDLDDALNELDLMNDKPTAAEPEAALDTELDLDLDASLEDLDIPDSEESVESVDDSMTPITKALESDTLDGDDLLAASDANSDISLDDEMAELDAELGLDDDLSSSETVMSSEKVDAELDDLDLELDDLDSLGAQLDGDVKSESAKSEPADGDLDLDELSLDDLELDQKKISEAESMDDLSLELDDVETKDKPQDEINDLDLSKDLDVDAELDIELELDEPAEKSAKDPSGDVDVDDLSLDDLLDSSQNIEESIDEVDAELDDLELDLDSLEEPSEDTDTDDVLNELDLELDLESFEADAANEQKPEVTKAPKKDEELDDIDLDDLTLELEPEAKKADSKGADDIEAQVSNDPDELDADDDFGFLNDSDEIATKLDLARAYIDMGDRGGAKEIIDEILDEGNDAQKKEAKELLEKLS